MYVGICHYCHFYIILIQWKMCVNTFSPEPFKPNAANSETKINADLYYAALRPKLMGLKSHQCCREKQGFAFLGAFVTRLPIF